MADPILSIGDIEPERPTVAIHRTTPATWWDRLKDRHLDVLLRWMPVRTERRHDLYPLRHPSEFGVRTIERIAAAQREIVALQTGELDPASSRRVDRLLREVSGLVLDAPGHVLDALSASQHIQLLMTFAVSAAGKTPTTPTQSENPLTSDDSSPDSAASTPATAGRTG